MSRRWLSSAFLSTVMLSALSTFKISGSTSQCGCGRYGRYRRRLLYPRRVHGCCMHPNRLVSSRCLISSDFLVERMRSAWRCYIVPSNYSHTLVNELRSLRTITNPGETPSWCVLGTLISWICLASMISETQQGAVTAFYLDKYI